MSGDSNGDEMGFKHGDETEISRLGITSMPLYTKADPFFSSTDWDPLVPTNAGDFSNSDYTSLVINCFPHYPPASGSSYCDVPASLLPFRAGETHEAHQISDEGVISTSQSRKRKQLEAASVSSLQWNKKAVEEIQEDSIVAEDQSQKNLKTEQSKETKETMNKESSQSGEAPKENYIHMRARRGQATNSHSLAERVRREKISERMRLLQELVPGCNKITGKAVMLDEIINYVQSLQQQVEFLSMKLATVNPELDKILAKDLLQSRDRNSSTLGLTPGLNPFTIFQGTIPNISINPQYKALPQTTVDSELQNLYQTGFVSNPSRVSTFSPNALSGLKPEL